MKAMSVSGKIGYVIIILGVVLIGIGTSKVSAETVTSPSYRIDGNFGGSFGGQTTSTSYKMSAIGGEAIVGDGASGSYMLDQQQTSTATPNMQLTVQPSGLVGFYPMDENVGETTADSSRYQHNGAIAGNAAWNANGKLGSAVDINGPTGGTSGSVNVSDHPNLPSGTQMTYESWINIDDPSVTRYIASQWGGGVNSWIFQFINKRLWVAVGSVPNSSIIDNYVITSEDVITGGDTWRHVAFVFDGGQPQLDRVKIYVDGIQVSTNKTGTFPAAIQQTSALFAIGSSNGFTAFPGLIDHVKIFDRALTASELKAEYTAQNAGISTGFGLDATPGVSSTSDIDAIVRTNRSYSISVQQDKDLQSGADFIPAVGGSIASPVVWSEGVTKGFGFTLTGAPNLNSKWGGGANYAAVPSSSTTFYDGIGSDYDVIDVVSLKLRLDAAATQTPGVYSNTITYTGTMIP